MVVHVNKFVLSPINSRIQYHQYKDQKENKKRNVYLLTLKRPPKRIFKEIRNTFPPRPKEHKHSVKAKKYK